MIVLDTNVIAELMRPWPSPEVVAWVQTASGLYTTTIAEAEVFAGILRLPAGKRYSELLAAAEAMFEEDFGDRVLPFDSEAARIFATLIASRRATGKGVSIADAQVAAIAISHGGRVATRNIQDFDFDDLEVVNPWNVR